MSDDNGSQSKDREMKYRGDLPARNPDGLWGKSASGVNCAICGLSTSSGKFELELLFSNVPKAAGVSYRAHPACFGKFTDELETLSREASANMPPK